MRRPHVEATIARTNADEKPPVIAIVRGRDPVHHDRTEPDLKAARWLLSGDSGWCADCGEAIPDKRLEIDPLAEKCIRCASGS